MRSIFTGLVSLLLTTSAMAQEVLTSVDVLKIIKQNGYNKIRLEEMLVGKKARFRGKLIDIDTTHVTIGRLHPDDAIVRCYFGSDQLGRARALNRDEVIEFVGEISILMAVPNANMLGVEKCRFE